MLLNTIPMELITGRAPRVVLSHADPERLPLVLSLHSGIEIDGEDENNSCNNELTAMGWSMHDDGSLRDGGAEFVLRDPLHGAALGNALEGFYSKVNTNLLSFSPSPRSGTHFHVNMTDRPFGHAQAMIAIMYVIDQLVFQWAGEDRRWCSYCNSLNTLPPQALRRVLRVEDISPHDLYREYVWPISGNDRYYGFNISSLWKYGTLEFRYFPTTLSIDKMWGWLDFCHSVWEAGSEFAAADNPAQAVLAAALADPRAFLVRILNAGPDQEAVVGLCNAEGWEQVIIDSASELELILSIEDSPSNVATAEPVWISSPYREMLADDDADAASLVYGTSIGRTASDPVDYAAVARSIMQAEQRIPTIQTPYLDDDTADLFRPV